MHLAKGAELLIFLKGALFKAEEGIVAERLALRAHFAPALVLSAAIDLYHFGDEPLFPLPCLQLFCCLLHNIKVRYYEHSLKKSVRICEHLTL